MAASVATQGDAWGSPRTAASIRLQHDEDFREWRAVADDLIAAGTPPEAVTWQSVAMPQADLFGATAAPVEAAATVAAAAIAAGSARWPREFAEAARRVICHQAPDRHAFLYRIAWRLQDNPRLLDLAADPDVLRLQRLDREIRRAAHKMKAFLRFRRHEDHASGGDDGVYLAWFDPGHPLLRALAPFFVRRFASLRWVIVTPQCSASWDGKALSFGPGAARSSQADVDPCEELWRTYYAHIFNPARLKTAAMLREMPRRYWRDLPEAPLIPALVQHAAPRTAQMTAADRHAELRAAAAGCDSLASLATALASCRLCEAGCNGTRPVPGEGPERARILIVGEQPGDQEELAGRPFVGPAGRVLQQALEAAGMRRESVYLTNAVKHFSFVPGRPGKPRLHKTPSRRIVDHCRWWLARERALVSPAVTIALGRTAALALLAPGDEYTTAGPSGFVEHATPAGTVLSTWHPARVLRTGGAREAAIGLEAIVATLKAATRKAAATR